ncbi:hypothetical protein ACLBWZ_10530 [Brucellaceae bacterium C25G]
MKESNIIFSVYVTFIFIIFSFIFKNHGLLYQFMQGYGSRPCKNLKFAFFQVKLEHFFDIGLCNTRLAGRGKAGYAGALLAEINARRKIIRIGSLPTGFKISVGDHIQIGARNLHQVVDVSGNQLEIRPD